MANVAGKVQVSDTTMLNSSTTAKYIKIKALFYDLTNKNFLA